MCRAITALATSAVLVMALLGACAGEQDDGSAEAERPAATETVPAVGSGMETGTGADADVNPIPAGPPAAGQPDAFGRLPGDPHYGHNHPPAGQPPAFQPPAGQPPANAPAAGEPDAHGRQPGDPHYGHGHP